MRRRLADSLRHIAEAADGRLGSPRPALEDFLRQLDAGPVSPLAFGAYCELVLAVEDDDMEAGTRLFAEIAAFGPHAGGPLVLDYSDANGDLASARYARHIDTDPRVPFRVYPPSAEASRSARVHIAAAFELLARGHPALADEIRTLLREIVLAVGPADPKAINFDGASSFMLWGGIVLNAQSYPHALDMLQALVHESGHNLLFGLCAEGSLVENEDDELFASPLRSDLRPMDGIVHATFVSARVHEALKRLVEADVVEPAQSAGAAKALADWARSYASGREVIAQHGRLTALGHAVMAGTDEYMRQNG